MIIPLFKCRCVHYRCREDSYLTDIIQTAQAGSSYFCSLVRFEMRIKSQYVFRHKIVPCQNPNNWRPLYRWRSKNKLIMKPRIIKKWNCFLQHKEKREENKSGKTKGKETSNNKNITTALGR